MPRRPAGAGAADAGLAEQPLDGVNELSKWVVTLSSPGDGDAEAAGGSGGCRCRPGGAPLDGRAVDTEAFAFGEQLREVRIVAASIEATG